MRLQPPYKGLQYKYIDLTNVSFQLRLQPLCLLGVWLCPPLLPLTYTLLFFTSFNLQTLARERSDLSHKSGDLSNYPPRETHSLSGMPHTCNADFMENDFLPRFPRISPKKEPRRRPVGLEIDPLRHGCFPRCLFVYNCRLVLLRPGRR